MTDLGIAESVDIKSENSFTELDIPVMLEKYSDTLSALDKRDGELWSVLPLTSPDRDTLSDQASGFLRRSASPTASVEVTLRKALPVPDREVPYEDLLDFKAKRKEQLDRLHSEISLLAGKYIHNKDDATALGLALMDLRTALSDLEKVYSERWTVRALKDLSSAFIINGLWPAGVTYMVGVPIDKAFLAGAGATVLHTAVAATVSAKHGSNPYAYAISAAAI
ncbi:DUF6236 family protein [Sulfitobacter delicatus]|nr:DUF6236 family protein [Sulfitobacter delicatus]